MRRKQTSALKDFFKKKKEPKKPSSDFHWRLLGKSVHCHCSTVYFYRRAPSPQVAAGVGTVIQVLWFPGGIPPNLRSRFPSANSPFGCLCWRHLERSFERILFTKRIKTPTQMSLWVSRWTLCLKCLDCASLDWWGANGAFSAVVYAGEVVPVTFFKTSEAVNKDAKILLNGFCRMDLAALSARGRR